MQYEGKVIWITEASSGIDAALAQAFAAQGALLVLSGRRTDALQSVADRLPMPSLIRPFETANRRALPGIVAQAIDGRGHVAGLVTNAAIRHRAQVGADHRHFLDRGALRCAAAHRLLRCQARAIGCLDALKVETDLHGGRQPRNSGRQRPGGIASPIALERPQDAVCSPRADGRSVGSPAMPNWPDDFARRDRKLGRPSPHGRYLQARRRCLEQAFDAVGSLIEIPALPVFPGRETVHFARNRSSQASCRM